MGSSRCSLSGKRNNRSRFSVYFFYSAMEFFRYHLSTQAELGGHFPCIDGPFGWQQLEAFDLFHMAEIGIIAVYDLPVQGQYPGVADQFLIGTVRDLLLFGPCF